MLDVGFDEARDRLAKLARWFPDASGDVYREEIAVLALIGPPGPALELCCPTSPATLAYRRVPCLRRPR